MKSKLNKFIGVIAIITLLYMVANDLETRLPAGIQGVVGFGLVVFFFWFVFDFVIKIIYRMSGITTRLMDPKPAKLNHTQAEVVKKYWIAWLATGLIVSIAYTLILHINHWKTSLIYGAAFGLLVMFGFLSSKQRIMGHTKEEIFK